MYVDKHQSFDDNLKKASDVWPHNADKPDGKERLKTNLEELYRHWGCSVEEAEKIQATARRTCSSPSTGW